jgi:hypothetical protein
LAVLGSADRLDLEFAYTNYRDSCRDLYSPQYRFRPTGRTQGDHAAAPEPSECAGHRTSGLRVGASVVR